MMTIKQDVAFFHELTGTPVCTVPAWPADERVILRLDLIREEVVRELLPAIEARDLVATADGIIDAIYVLVGAALEFGLPLENLWAEVQRANASKAVFDEELNALKIIRRPDGKILKPEGWVPPNIEAVLRAYGWQGAPPTE